MPVPAGKLTWDQHLICCHQAQAEESIIDLGSGLKVFNLLRPLTRWAWGRFAQQPQWRALVSWESYYREYLNAEGGHALIQHIGPYVGDAARQNELINGMAAGRGPAIVWAPPGCGKSRFAIELARRIEKARRSWQVLFVQHDESVVREELHHLTQSRRVVLIVDDAHECPDLVKLLAAACARTSSASQLHLVCLTRSTGRAQVSQAINSASPPGLVQEMDLGRPTAQLVRTLIDQLLPKSSPHHRETIGRFVRQSYFGAVLVCTILRRQGKLPQTFARQDLRDRVCREPLREAADGVCPIETALRALAVYAALAPVPKARAAVRELAAQLSALAPERVEVLLERVLAAGLFQEYGRALVRPVPDLLGDLILEEACLDGQGRSTPFSTELLERVFEFDAVTAVSNCADIGQLFGSAQDVDVVSTLILARARAVPAEKTWDILKVLQTCQPLAARRPATVLEVASILEGRAILRRTPPADELFGIDSIEMTTCALLMRAGEVDPTAVPVALGLARDLYAAARGGDASTQQHVRDQLDTYCKFEMGRSVAHAQAVVNTLRTWVSESDAQAAALAGSLSTRFLRLEVQGQREEGHSLTWLRGPLNPGAEVWAVRDVAVDTLVRGLSHAAIAVQCASMSSLEQYAETQLAPDQVPIETWRAQLAREIERLSSAVLQRVKTTEHLPLCAIAEHLGWHWWSQDLDLLHRAGMAILESTRDTDGYRLWKLLYAQRLPVWTVVPQVTAGDIETRRQHVQAMTMIQGEAAPEQARRLFDELDLRHGNNSAWSELWRSVCNQSSSLLLHNQADVVVGEFARRHPETAWSWVTEAEADGPLCRLLPFLLVELGNQDRARRGRLARDVRAGTRLEKAWLRALWSAQEPGEAERALLARSLGSTDAETVQHAASALLNASRADRIEAYKAVFAAIAQQPTQSALWRLVIERFVDWADGVLAPLPAEPDEAIVGVASDFLRLLQAHGSHVRWGFQPHTRQLPQALAILMVVHPQRLQDWMRAAWGPGKGPRGGWDDESPLSVSRLSEIMRLIRGLPAATQWVEVFSEWMKRDTHLGTIGALGLAELCSLDDPRIGELVKVIGAQPTEASVQAFTEFIQHQNSESGFAGKALALLEVWTRFPDSYARIEKAVISALVHGAGGRALGQVSPAHARALQAIDARRAHGASSGLLLASLDRAEREVREAVNDQVAQDEEFE